MRKLKIAILFSLIILLKSSTIYSSNIDSLLEHTKNITKLHDTTKINLYNTLAFEYYRKHITDSIKFFATKALHLSAQRKYLKGLAFAYKNMGVYYFSIGNYKSAEIEMKKSVEYFKRLIKEEQSKEIFEGYGSILQNLGVISKQFSEYSQSIQYIKEAISIFSNYCPESKKIVNTYTTLGNTYIDLGDYIKAIEYYQNALRLSKQFNDDLSAANILLNLGIVHSAQNNYETANEYFNEASSIYEKFDNKNNIAECYNKMGINYLRMKLFDKASDYLHRSLELFILCNNPVSIAMVYYSIGEYYLECKKYNEALKSFTDSYNTSLRFNKKNLISDILYNMSRTNYLLGNFNEATNLALQSYTIALKAGRKQIIKEASKILFELYYKQGNYKQACDYLQISKQYSDSILNEEKIKQATEMEARYQTEKKEHQIKLQQAEILKKDEQARRKDIQRNAFIIGFLLMGGLAFVVFQNYKQKKKSNQILSVQNRIISEKNIEILQQAKELEIKNTMLTDSIIYAKRIQNAILPPKESISKYFTELFIFYKPRDIVSGDFYWFSQKNNSVFIAVVDCTGHGVPGAFMSMIGNALLNTYINEKNITNTAEIITKMDESIKALGHYAEQSQVDGMELTICRFDKNSNTFKYACANHSLLFVKNGQVQLLQGDRFNIMGYRHTKLEVSFHEYEVEFSQNDSVYLYTDGYIDQFGGPNNKKFSFLKFKELIQSISPLPIEAQSETIANTMNEWMNNRKQTDDMLVIGFKITPSIFQ